MTNNFHHLVQYLLKIYPLVVNPLLSQPRYYILLLSALEKGTKGKTYSFLAPLFSLLFSGFAEK